MSAAPEEPRMSPTYGNGKICYIEIPATVDKVMANGGEIVQPIGADAPEITARFRDPAGNVLGIYQQPS
jgi:predicted enzyme related to lactoylglutathione lyase